MVSLIDTLLRQTRSGAISWQDTDLGGTFVYTSPSGSVAVRGPASNLMAQIMYPYSVEILDTFGNKVEVFRTSLLGDNYRPLVELVSEVSKRFKDGDPLLDQLRQEAAAASSFKLSP